MSTPLSERDGKFHGDIEKGIAAEKSFEQTMQALGYKVEESTVHEDRTMHIDFHVTVNGNRHSIDVKSMKSMPNNISDSQAFWIELINVNGDAGWLYGEAECIAFERRYDFVIVSRAKLERAMYNKVLPLAKSYGDMRPMHGYRRQSDQSLMTIVEFAYLQAIGAILSLIEKKH